jgi:hypothetical protein
MNWERTFWTVVIAAQVSFFVLLAGICYLAGRADRLMRHFWFGETL